MLVLLTAGWVGPLSGCFLGCRHDLSTGFNLKYREIYIRNDAVLILLQAESFLAHEDNSVCCDLVYFPIDEISEQSEVDDGPR